MQPETITTIVICSTVVLVVLILVFSKHPIELTGIYEVSEKKKKIGFKLTKSKASSTTK